MALSEWRNARLAPVRTMIAKGQFAQALKAISELLKSSHDPEIHTLHLQLLIPELQDIAGICDSFDWLEANHPDDENLPELLSVLQQRVSVETDKLYILLSKGLNSRFLTPPFGDLDRLQPLAERCPAIHAVRGLLLARLAKAFNEKASPDGFRFRRNLEAYRAECERSSQETAFKVDGVSQDAEKHLTLALAGLSTSDNLCAPTMEALGDLANLAQQFEIALKWYEQAQAAGLPLMAKIEAIRPEVISRMKVRLFQYLDSLLEREQVEQASSLLRACKVLGPLPDLQIRQAELALLRGQFAAAEAIYLEALRSDAPDFPAVITMEQIDPILAQIPSVFSKLAATNDNLPGLRYGLAANDLRGRALVGLVTTYQGLNRPDQAHARLGELLKERKQTLKNMEVLIGAVQDTERQMQAQQYEQLRGEAMSLWRAEAWPAAVDKYYELATFPMVNPIELGRLAVALYRANATWQDPQAARSMGQQFGQQFGQSPLEAILHTLGRVSPEALASLPAADVCDLLDYLADADHWATSDPFVPALLAVDPGVDRWLDDYRNRRDEFIQASLKRGETALAKAQAADAEREAERVLAIEPTYARASLLLGRALTTAGKLAPARKLLLTLLDDPTVERETILALVEVELARNYPEEAHQWLSRIPDATADAGLIALKTGLENRLAGQPAFYIAPADSIVSVDSLRRIDAPGTWVAIFAVRLIGVRAVRYVPPVREQCAELLTALSHSENLGLTMQFSWRYIGCNGSVSLALLCRAEADSEGAAIAAGRMLWETIKNLLPLRDEIFTYQPVYSLGELDDLRVPCEVDSATEIIRQEVTVRMDDQSDGQSNGEVYLVYPYALHDASLQRLLQTLADQTQPTVLDIHFQPTTILPWERSTLLNMLNRQKHVQRYQEMLPSLLETPSTSASDFRQNLVTQLYPDFLSRTQSIAFVVQVQIATQGKMDVALSNAVSMNLFGTSRYEIIPAMSDRDVATVCRNLAEIVAERWVYSAAPDGLERLRHLLTPDEALTATRLPVPNLNGLPGIPTLKIRSVALPANLPSEGVMIGESIMPIRGYPVSIRATAADRMRHTYVVGRTGSGKSTLLQNMALQDIEAGRGVGVVDPHGDLVEAILERIPAHRMQDVVLFDPSDTERPIALNILDVEGTFAKNMVVADFIGLLYSMFDPHNIGIMGPRLENAVRNAMLAIMEGKTGTLIEVVRMLSDKDFREQVVKTVTDPVVHNYWTNIANNFERLGEGNMSDYVTSKFGRFVDDQMMRNIIGQSQNTIDFREIMDQGKILLVNLAKGKIGPQNSHFLGLLLVPRLLIAALSRAQIDTDKRRPYFLYVDEFHNFTTPAFGVMLSEVRKYGIAMTVANQFISQLDNDIRESVFGNVGSMMVFQVGIKDANFLTSELYPADVDDLINLPNHHMLAKMLINGNAAPTFPIRTLLDNRIALPSRAAMIRSYSRQRYGRDALVVEYEIQQRFTPVPPPVKKPANPFGGLFNKD